MQGYYRFPTIFNNKIIFVSEDDLWSVNLDNSKAFRLTTNISEVSSPLISPDGKWIAFVGSEDGNNEVYIMPSTGGPSTRLTFDGAFVKGIAAMLDIPLRWGGDWNDNTEVKDTGFKDLPHFELKKSKSKKRA